MINLKKIILATSFIGFLSSPAYGEEVKANKVPVVSDLELKLSGYGHFQSGFRNQSKLKGDEKNVSANRKTVAFYNEAALSVDGSKTINDITYGGRVVLVPTAQRKGGVDYNGSHIYLKSDFGKIELGSPIPPSGQMMIDGSAIAAATFDDWTRYANFESTDLKQGKQLAPGFAISSEYFLDSKLVTNTPTKRPYSSEPARSIAYYTPKYEIGVDTKVQIGVSYIPDSSNTGADNPSVNSNAKLVREIKEIVNGAFIEKYEIDNSVKNALSGGICLEHNITDGVDVKVALTGEYGKAAGSAKKFLTATDTTPTVFKLSDLRTYNIGAVLNVGNFSYAGSYGTLGKSLTTPEFHKTGRSTDYYSGSVAYKQGPFATSLSYFKSSQFKNTVDAFSLGTSYLLAPGFKPYAEVSTYTLKGRPEFYPELAKKKTRGTVALIGAKLSL